LEETVRLIIAVPELQQDTAASEAQDTAVALADSFLSRLEARIEADMDDSAATVENIPKEITRDKSVNITKPGLVNVTEASLGVVAGRSGRGGISILPAWMTAPGLGASIATETEEKGISSAVSVTSEQLGFTTVDPASEITEEVLNVVAGRSGRGLSMLPAWMTAPGLGAKQDSSATSVISDHTLGDIDTIKEPEVVNTKRLREEAESSTAKRIKLDSGKYGPGDECAHTKQVSQNDKIYGPSIDKILENALTSIEVNLVSEEELRPVEARKLISAALQRATEKFL